MERTWLKLLFFLADSDQKLNLKGRKLIRLAQLWKARSTDPKMERSRINNSNIWVFPKMGVPQNGWLIMENPIKMDDLGGTTIFGNMHIGQLK